MPIAMAALVDAATRQHTITYKDIAQSIERRLKSAIAAEHVGTVVGSMMDEIYEVDPKAPPLNALCVNGVTKLPGDGAHAYIKWFNPSIDYKNRSNAKKREALLPVYEQIFKFKKWPQLARRVFGIAVQSSLSEQTGEKEGKARRLATADLPRVQSICGSRNM